MKKTTRSAPLGASLVVLSSFFYASYGIWTKLMGNLFDGYTSSVLRSLLVLIMIVPIAIGYRKFEPLKLKKNWPYIAGMLLASPFIWGPLYYAILHAGVGISLAVNYGSMVLGMFIFGWLFAGERFSKSKAISAILGFIGLALIFLPHTSKFALLGLFAALVSGTFSAASSVMAKQIRYGASQSTIIWWLTTLIANGFIVVVLGKSLPAIGWHIQWFYLLLFALASVIATWSFIKGVKLIDAGAAGILGLLEIVFGVLFGVVFFSERPATTAIIGMAVIVVATAVPYMQYYNAQKGITS